MKIIELLKFHLASFFKRLAGFGAQKPPSVSCITLAENTSCYYGKEITIVLLFDPIPLPGIGQYNLKYQGNERCSRCNTSNLDFYSRIGQGVYSGVWYQLNIPVTLEQIPELARGYIKVTGFFNRGDPNGLYTMDKIHVKSMIQVD